MPRSAAINASATFSGDPSGGTVVVDVDAGTTVGVVVELLTSVIELRASVAPSSAHPIANRATAIPHTTGRKWLLTRNEVTGLARRPSVLSCGLRTPMS